MRYPLQEFGTPLQQAKNTYYCTVGSASDSVRAVARPQKARVAVHPPRERSKHHPDAGGGNAVVDGVRCGAGVALGQSAAGHSEIGRGSSGGTREYAKPGPPTSSEVK